MKKLLVVCCFAILAGCGEANMRKPRVSCAEYGPVKQMVGKYGTYEIQNCLREEITCLSPLKLTKLEDGNLICELMP